MIDERSITVVPVYDGAAIVGEIAQRGDYYEARPCGGQSLGHYNKWKAASDAIYFHAHQRRCICEG